MGAEKELVGSDKGVKAVGSAATGVLCPVLEIGRMTALVCICCAAAGDWAPVDKDGTASLANKGTKFRALS